MKEIGLDSSSKKEAVMGSSSNIVLIAGRLIERPVLRKTLNGTIMTDLKMNFEKAPSYSEDTNSAVDVIVWGRQAELCVHLLQDQAEVLVKGRLQMDVWHSNNGLKKCKLRVTAEEIKWMESGTWQAV